MGENSIKTKEPVYVVVTKSLDEESERIELPTEQDHTLRLQTLIDAFPGARGLKYKNLSTGAYRALSKNETGTKFYPPPDGWSKKVFIVLLPESTAHEINQNKKDSYTPEALLEVVKKFVCADYFETQTKNCVVVLNKQVAATFKHGTHEHLRHGQILDIYDYNDSRIPVMCAYIHPTMDFILYVRLEGEFEFIPKIGFPIQGSHYILLGFPFLTQTVQCVFGTVSAVECSMTTRVLGQGGSVKGYSGGPAFSLKTGALFAMNISGPPLEMYIHNSPTSLVEIFHASKEETFSLMLPITAIDIAIPIAIETFKEWSGGNKTTKIDDVKDFLTVDCGINSNEANELAKKLVDNGISMLQIEEKLKEFVGHVVRWIDIPKHKKKILDGLNKLLSNESSDSSFGSNTSNEMNG